MRVVELVFVVLCEVVDDLGIGPVLLAQFRLALGHSQRSLQWSVVVR